MVLHYLKTAIGVAFFTLMMNDLLGQDLAVVSSEDAMQSEIQQASMVQPTPFLKPSTSFVEPAPGTTPLTQFRGIPASTRRTAGSDRMPVPKATFPNGDIISGEEAFTLSSGDLGSLIKKSTSGLSTSVQNKSTGSSDPRIRGARTDAGNASGSHWIPARADLDSVLGKFDSRQVKSVSIVPGPYSSMYGPGFSFTDVELVGSPRFRGGAQMHGETDLEYKANGNQMFGQQSFLYGSDNFGARFNYASREVDDYFAGGRLRIPAGYQSQEMLFATGRDFGDDSVEFSILKLDQTNIVYPGYVFDLDYLKTDGLEVTHTGRNRGGWDSIVTEAWYNRTVLSGNALNPRKRAFFPGLVEIDYVGSTDVDSMSTGYREQFILGDLAAESFQFSLGHDLRWVKQELNEISSGVTPIDGIAISNRNSPIPRSYTANPGVFLDYQETLGEQIGVHFGGRLDYARSDISEKDPSKFNNLGLDGTAISYESIVGTAVQQRDFGLGSAFLSLRRDFSDEFTTTLSGGYAERAPTLTALYAAQPFMLLLQNGLNNVTGDPTLAKERLFQLDVGWELREEQFKTGARAFHMWGLDYITFENTEEQAFDQDTRQVNLRYVNTELATILGGEWFGELFPKSPITPFGNLRVLDGRDRTRNGRFATAEATPSEPSSKDYTRSRGFFGIGGAASESLPGIPPLDARLGVRLHDTSPRQDWNIELTVRIVDSQNKVATSLRESRTPGFSTCDLRSVFRVRQVPGMVFATGVENMFDRLYREHFDFRAGTGNGLAVYQPGANFYVSTSLSY